MNDTSEPKPYYTVKVDGRLQDVGSESLAELKVWIRRNVIGQYVVSDQIGNIVDEGEI